MNIRPSSRTFARLACAAWGLALIEMVANIAPIKLFLGLLAVSATLSICAAIRYHGVIVASVTKEHAGTMGKQVFSAERWATNRWRGERLAEIDAAAAYSGSPLDSGPFRVFGDSKM